MRRKPRDRRAGLIGRSDLMRIIAIAVGMAAVAGAVFWWALDSGRPIEEARAMAVNAVVAAEIAYLLVTATVWPLRIGGINLVAMGMIGAVVLLQLAVTQIVPIARLLGMAPLTAVDWAIVAVAGVAVLLLGLVDRLFRRRAPSASSPAAR